MKVDVYGAIFYDIYIYGDEPHNSKIIEVPGGSGFNIAYLLYKLGYEINFKGFLGNDYKGEYLKRIIPFHPEVKNEKTAVFISKNDIPIAVERKINESEYNDLRKNADIAIITTEISKEELKRIEKLNYKKVFFDIGPRPFISNGIFEKAFIIGTENECKYRKCDVIKIGEKGVIYKKKIFSSNKKIANYKIGLGDIFDGLFIDNYLKRKSIESSIINAIKRLEKVLDMPTAYNKIKAL
ncbi:Sugar or nucleoside kinase, ribokinase family [Marinitoga hydrogenitolerans DSM 16785]|uniref:Sugar or nucleoside kinase, ribokinase family n=1 Tax=Marinitoga hydrogenitolerans (strain DSM 16785 / JCM 12826 / AT1271) TaxID=1122195 RepID=A0A1M5AWK5_MARH1|nr:hypothetical protein [Marinitoga hydrogenitolerans]SHF34599.1 Sugar or nucleoside kinase, ribokinase family [Marinitoga hydrogenitolerans DSM 16785]